MPGIGGGGALPMAPVRLPGTAEPEAAARRALEGADARGGAGGSGGSSAVAAAALPAAVRGALELAEARRRLLEAESRRRLVSELESRVHQLHRVFVEAELRLAHRAEHLGRLGGGVAQAELHLTAYGQRLKKPLRRAKKVRPPALLASALGLGGCVPWAAGQKRRGGRAGGPEPPPESPFKRSIQAAPAASTQRSEDRGGRGSPGRA